MDDGAATLTHACREAGIAPSLVGDASRPTTTKVRIVTDRNQQVARIDYEADVEIADDVERRILAEIEKHAPRAIGDRHLGLSEGVHHAEGRADRVASAARPGVPVLVDPKIPHIDYYAGTTLVTPNHHEAEIASNMRVRSEDEARAAARQFRDARAVRERADDARRSGNVAAEQRQRGTSALRGTRGRRRHRCGRHGDCHDGASLLAAGATMSEAARLANEAAGIVGGQVRPRDGQRGRAAEGRRGI